MDHGWIGLIYHAAMHLADFFEGKLKRNWFPTCPLSSWSWPEDGDVTVKVIGLVALRDLLQTCSCNDVDQNPLSKRSNDVKTLEPQMSSEQARGSALTTLLCPETWRSIPKYKLLESLRNPRPNIHRKF